MPFASFYLKELSTDSHYLLNGETFPFTFEYAGASVPVVEIKANNGEAIENKLIRGAIKGMKTDENGTGLEGAVIGCSGQMKPSLPPKTPSLPQLLWRMAASVLRAYPTETGC